MNGTMIPEKNVLVEESHWETLLHFSGSADLYTH